MLAPKPKSTCAELQAVRLLVMISSFAAGLGSANTCETGKKAAVKKSTEPTRRIVAATRSVLI